jgi:hypothetical protein
MELSLSCRLARVDLNYPQCFVSSCAIWAAQLSVATGINVLGCMLMFDLCLAPLTSEQKKVFRSLRG